MVRGFSNRRMAGRFSVCVYNFLETRSTLGESQLANKCRLIARAINIQTSDLNKPIDTRAIAVRSEPYAGGYESDCSNCKCRRRNNFIKRTNSVLVRRVQSASRYISRLIRSMVCHVVERVTTNHDQIAQPRFLPANDQR